MEAVRKLQWWRENSPSLPVWAKAARMAFGLSCTSAAAERVFSLVDGMIGAHQVTVLADQVQAGVMLRYNKGLDLELVSGSPQSSCEDTVFTQYLCCVSQRISSQIP